jgi:hypothetical protein
MIGDLSHTVFDAAFMRGVPVICDMIAYYVINEWGLCTAGTTTAAVWNDYLDNTWINRFGAALW